MGVAQDVTAASFLPDPALLIKVKGEVAGKKEETDAFTLNHPDILSLMRYVYAGATLPQTEDDYSRRMDIAKDTVKDVKDEIAILVKVYKDIAIDNIEFRDKTWVSLVDLSGEICNFAKLAGGKEIDASYFAQLLLAITDFNVAKLDGNEQKMKIARSDIVDFTSKLVASTSKMQKDSKTAKDKIATFKNATTNHALELKTTDEKVKAMLKKAGVDITTLEKKIKDLQTQLEDQQAEYDHDVVVAATTPTYAWAGPIGLIAAISVASVYGSRATAMKNAIEATQSEIESEQGKLKTAKIISIDSQRMSVGTQAIIELIDPAIKTLAKLETVWQRISSDLEGLCEQAKNDPDHIPGIRMGTTEIKNMMNSWNQLYDYVDKYRTTAYVSQPEVTTLKGWLEKFGKAKN